MKTCPACKRTYEDDSLVYCLDDGARLAREAAGSDPNATWNLPAPGPTVASPRPAHPTAQSTISALPEQFKATPSPLPRNESRTSALPWVFAIVLVLGASGVLIAWFMTRAGGGDSSARYAAPTPAPSIMSTPSRDRAAETGKTATPNERAVATPDRPASEKNKAPLPTPAKERPKAAFAMLNNTSFNGSRITYYQSASFALCQADCAANANCKGLTWIRPGAYNPSDPGMCYLMAAVTQKIGHVCCISALKN
jgi:hypothetical protein